MAPTLHKQTWGLFPFLYEQSRSEESHISEPRINERIRVPEVRLVGPNGEQVGIVRVEDALRLAQEADLDLVEVAPDARPPVCKLMDFGKFKYEADMKAREARRNQANTILKEIRFRLKIDPHDYGTKKGHVERFLSAGDKVKVMIMFRGREQSRPEMGVRLLQRLAEDVVELGFIESMPKQDGRNMIMVLGPTKKKAEAKSEARRKTRDAAPKSAEQDSSVDEEQEPTADVVSSDSVESVGTDAPESIETPAADVADEKVEAVVEQESVAPVAEAKPAEAKPAEAKPAEAKPAAAKPAAAKPAAAKPAAAPAKPAAAKPASAPAKPAASKPAAAKPATTKPAAAPAKPAAAKPAAAAPKPAAKPVMAKPVATPKPVAKPAAAKPAAAKPASTPKPAAEKAPAKAAPAKAEAEPSASE